LQVRSDDVELRAWVLANLNDYWRRWSERTGREVLNPSGVPPRRAAAWGVLGAPRLHYTIVTGGVATKEVAAQHALQVFEPRWRGVIEDSTAYWRGEPSSREYRSSPGRRRRDAAQFVAYVIQAANQLRP
jgi:hypothetical protein